MKKYVLFLLTSLFLFMSITGCSSTSSTNYSTTFTTVTTTEMTTLSKEEIENNRIKDMRDDVSTGLKEKYNYSSVQCSGYINFQDFVRGLESDPSEYFFIGSDFLDLSLEYKDTKLFKNSDALSKLKEWEIIDADYMLVCSGTKKDAYGKEKEIFTNIVIKIKDEDNYTWWVFDSFDGISLGAMITGVAVERCHINLLI